MASFENFRQYSSQMATSRVKNYRMKKRRGNANSSGSGKVAIFNSIDLSKGNSATL